MHKESVVLVAVVLFGCVAAVHHATMLTIDKNTATCGDEYTVKAGAEYIVKSMGESPGVDCSYVFKGQMKDNCMGLCYDMKSGSVFKNAFASLTVVSGSYSKVFDSNDMKTGPWCSEEMTMSVSLTVSSDYVYDPKNPGYDFSLAVYNKCGQPGSGKSITFEEAVKNIEGYHHGQEFEDREHTTLVHGLLVGFGLASIFLILLFVTYCYVKNNPDSGRSRSKSKARSMGTPMSARQPTKKPEDVELLAVSADPEKPPSN